MKRLLFPALAAACILAALFPVHAQQTPAPLRLAIAGLVHGHVTGFLRAAQARKDVQIVGVFDPDTTLQRKYAQRYGLADAVLFTDLAAMLDRAKPEAVAAFTNTYDHPVVVEAAASRGIDVMMEKPLAVSNAHAQRIRRAADRGGIDVLVNYETTWYPSHGAIWTLVKERGGAGGIRKMVAMDGHEGPKAINVQPEFLEWLSDPVKNGGGALFDFGCYGANLMTWLMDNQRPIAVTAITQQFQPAVYPRVDDEATILLEYPTGAGHYPGVVELAVQPQGPRGLRREGARDRHGRQRPSREAAEGAGARGDPGSAAGRRGRFDCPPHGGRARHAKTQRPVLARQQHDRHRNPRGRARIGADPQAGAARTRVK